MRARGCGYCFQPAFCDVIRSVVIDASFSTGRPCYGASLRQLALVKLNISWSGKDETQMETSPVRTVDPGSLPERIPAYFIFFL